jgi:hypothetical protein
MLELEDYLNGMSIDYDIEILKIDKSLTQLMLQEAILDE